VAGLGLDADTVAAALLHDAVEDTGITLEDVEGSFGAGRGPGRRRRHKLDRLQFDSKEAQQAATIRKMLVAMASDWRVLLIKLADRLHNMRTLAVMPSGSSGAPARRPSTSMRPGPPARGQQVKWQLEDWPLPPFIRSAMPRSADGAARAPQREEYLARVLISVRERLGSASLDAEVTGRPKHLWSIYEKMVVRGKEFDDIHDLVGIRVVVASEKDCWPLSGHPRIWPPVQGRFKTTSTPRSSTSTSRCTPRYRSRRQADRGPGAHPRDAPCAEYGIAAHWGYKEKDDASWTWPGCNASPRSRGTNDPVEFLEALKLDLEQDEVYVFTPKGR